jgi:hypothetical protein
LLVLLFLFIDENVKVFNILVGILGLLKFSFLGIYIVTGRAPKVHNFSEDVEPGLQTRVEFIASSEFDYIN